MFCAQIPFSFESIFPFFPSAVPIFALYLAARTVIFLKHTLSCSIPLILHVLCSDSSLSFVSIFSFFSFIVPVFTFYLFANAIIFLSSHASSVCSCLFCFCNSSLRLVRLIVLSFIVLPNNQNPTSSLRHFISDFCDICFRVNCALNPLLTHFKFCIHKRSLEKLLL